MKPTVLLFAAIAAFAQGRPPNSQGLPDNYYGPATLQATADTVNLAACLRVAGTNQPVPGAGVSITTYTTCASGYHGHDSSCATGRPQATFTTPTSTTTDASGCGYWTAQFPGYAGYYTFVAQFSNGLTAGLNDYAKEFDSYETGELNMMIPFTNYPTNPLINNTSNYPTDTGHSQLIRYFVPEVSNVLQAASNDYVNRSAKLLGYFDRLLIWRGSLPDGGTLDDYTSLPNGSQPQWDATTPLWEEHSEGVEVDILNPYPPGNTGGVLNPYAPDLATFAMENQQCFLGAYPVSFQPQPPMFGRVSLATYWNGQAVMHFACGFAPIHRQGGDGPVN
jgi:hypothetical protein